MNRYLENAGRARWAHDCATSVCRLVIGDFEVENHNGTVQIVDILEHRKGSGSG